MKPSECKIILFFMSIIICPADFKNVVCILLSLIETDHSSYRISVRRVLLRTYAREEISKLMMSTRMPDKINGLSLIEDMKIVIG